MNKKLQKQIDKEIKIIRDEAKKLNVTVEVYIKQQEEKEHDSL